jgi:hypothetical protein
MTITWERKQVAMKTAFIKLSCVWMKSWIVILHEVHILLILLVLRKVTLSNRNQSKYN